MFNVNDNKHKNQTNGYNFSQFLREFRFSFGHRMKKFIRTLDISKFMKYVVCFTSIFVNVILVIDGAAVLHAISWLNIITFHSAHPDSKGKRKKKQMRKYTQFFAFALLCMKPHKNANLVN